MGYVDIAEEFREWHLPREWEKHATRAFLDHPLCQLGREAFFDNVVLPNKHAEDDVVPVPSLSCLDELQRVSREWRAVAISMRQQVLSVSLFDCDYQSTIYTAALSRVRLLELYADPTFGAGGTAAAGAALRANLDVLPSLAAEFGALRALRVISRADGLDSFVHSLPSGAGQLRELAGQPDELLEVLTACPNLERVDLSGTEYCRRGSQRVYSAIDIAKRLSKMPRLRHVQLAGMDVRGDIEDLWSKDWTAPVSTFRMINVGPCALNWAYSFLRCARKTLREADIVLAHQSAGTEDRRVPEYVLQPFPHLKVLRVAHHPFERAGQRTARSATDTQLDDWTSESARPLVELIKAAPLTHFTLSSSTTIHQLRAHRRLHSVSPHPLLVLLQTKADTLQHLELLPEAYKKVRCPNLPEACECQHPDTDSQPSSLDWFRDRGVCVDVGGASPLAELRAKDPAVWSRATLVTIGTASSFSI